MKQNKSLLASLMLGFSLLVSSSVFAAKTYQVTGTVIKLTDKLITVQKANDEKWEIDRTPATKVTGELKEGAKVTIEYTMSASDIEVKLAK